MILLIARLRAKRVLIALVNKGIPITSRPNPARAEYVRLMSRTTRVITIATGEVQTIWNIPDA